MRLLSLLILLLPGLGFAQNSQGLSIPGMSINFGQGVDLVDTMQLLAVFTLLTLAPAILVLCTCFTRIIVVLAFMRQAIGTQNMPPNQLLIGFAMFLTFFVMQPTGEKIYNNAINRYVEKKLHQLKLLKILRQTLEAL